MGIIDRPNELLRVVREALGLKVGEKFTVEGINQKHYFTDNDIMLELKESSKTYQLKSNISLSDLCHKRIERVD
jgi:hypothetical protein